jgi:hypothetical protein
LLFSCQSKNPRFTHGPSSTHMINFVLPVPNNLVAPFHVLYSVLVVIESLQLQNRRFDKPHVFVQVTHLVNLLLLCSQRPYDLVQDHLCSPQFLFFCGLKLLLTGALNEEKHVFVPLDEKGLTNFALDPLFFVLKLFMMLLLLYYLILSCVLSFLF